jgi:hypothetical protein
LAVLVACGSCSDDDDAGGGKEQPPDAFNGDCGSARWSNLSPACWSCMCGACPEQLNACTEGCVSAFECALEQDVLVGVADELLCEIRGTAALCLREPATQGAARQLIDFDTCLIARREPSSHLRVCERECGIQYSGDVCERFP